MKMLEGRMTSPWRNGKSYLFKGLFLLRGVSAPSCILKSVSVRHLSTYSLCFMILAWCAAGERVLSMGSEWVLVGVWITQRKWGVLWVDTTWTSIHRSWSPCHLRIVRSGCLCDTSQLAGRLHLRLLFFPPPSWQCS